MILAIETATAVCSVALELEHGRVVEKRTEGRGVHSEKTFTFIQELLDRNNLSVDDLDGLLFSSGPGSYTGLRIGAAAIKGLLFQKEVPLYTFCTLTSYAQPSIKKAPVVIHAVIDARREHLYHRKVEVIKDSSDKQSKKMENLPEDARNSTDSFLITRSDARIMEIKELEKEILPGEIVSGTGWERMTHSDQERMLWSGSEKISATNLIRAWNSDILKPLFKREDVEQFEPDYLTMAQVNNSAI